MHLDRRIKTQLIIFLAISLVAAAIMVFGYLRLPTMLFGVGHYTVTVELPSTGGLYPSANVTYRGTEVGRVHSVDLTDTGVTAVLSLRSDVAIPKDLDAQVHSQTSIGEQYLALLPRSNGPRLKDGDVIPVSRTSVPPDVSDLLDATDRGLRAIPRDNLKTVVDESFTAVGGKGPDISRIIRGSTELAIDARANLDALTSLIDQSEPVLNSQAQSADAIKDWAAHLAIITDQLQTQDKSFAGVLQHGDEAANQARQLLERAQPSLPVLLANLVTLGKIAITYQPAIEQILVLIPQVTAEFQGGTLANRNTKQDYSGAYLDFNLNLNLPPPCTTGFLPAQQHRAPTLLDYPDRPAGDLYCRIPQDAPFTAVRGARNLPCLTVPGKRAPTVKMCESDENYVPLNDGNNWKGDPNATMSGQDIPQLPPASPPVPRPPTATMGEVSPIAPLDVPSSPAEAAPSAPLPPPDAQPPKAIAVEEYDPATGSYVGPDGNVYTQSDLANTSPKEKTWQTMLLPPTLN